MKKVFTVIIILSLGFHFSFGQKTDENLIHRAALSFIRSNFPESPRTIENVRFMGNEDGQAEIYVIDLHPEGWILFSADKRAEPVIGFSLSGNFKIPGKNKLNPAYGWLKEIENDLRQLEKYPEAPQNRQWSEILNEQSLKKQSTSSVTVPNLIKVSWDQGRYYNQFCPEDEKASSGHVPVGCVAVSMGQAMSTFSFPPQGTGSYNYFHDIYGTQVANFGQTTYLWDSMDATGGDEHNALLLYHCAVSVDMDFGVDGSGSRTSKASSSLKKYFLYSGNVKSINRLSDDELWKELIIEELTSGRPVIYSGDGNDGEPGHAFNIDGVLNGKYFHVNWGWGGTNNGFFVLDDMTPGSNNFNFDQAVITGIQPLYFPKDIVLEDTVIGFEQPQGTAVGKLTVIDEAQDNIYEVSFRSDSSFIDGLWQYDFYLEEDTLRANRSFGEDEEGIRQIYVSLTDMYGHYIEKSIDVHISESFAQNTGFDNRKILTEYFVYPNPVQQTLYIKGANDSGSYGDVKIYSVLGNLMIRKPGHNFSEGIAVDGLTQGVYFLEVSPEPDKVQMIKFLKR